MKKRALSLLLTMALLLSLVVPVGADAGDYEMKIVGIAEEFYSGTNGITFDLQLQGAVIGGTSSVLLKLDATKVQPARYSAAADLTFATSVGLGTIGGATAKQLYLDEEEILSGCTIRATKKGDVIFMSVQPEMETTSAFNNELTSAVKFRLAFVGSTTVDDLDKSTIQVLSLDEVNSINQDQAAIINSGSADSWEYNTTRDPDATLHDLPEPQIIYPNSDVINLNGVKVDAEYKYVNVPVSLPEVGDDVTVQASAKGYYAPDCAEGTEIESGVNFKYSVAMKDGSDLPETVSIDETTGLMTIKAGAPEAVVVITATGSYTNDKGNLSNASGTYEVSLRHGDAEEKNNDDPSDPPKPAGGDPDVTKALSGVAIYEGTTQITTSAAATTAEKPIAIPASGSNDVAFTASEVDQFGDAMAATVGAWDAFTGAAGVTFSNGTVSVATGAAKGTYPVSYTAGGYTATVNVIVDSVAITWPTLENDTITYGQAVSELKINHDGKVEDENGEVADVAFAWTDDTVILAAGSQTVQMTCTYGTETATKGYTVTVNQAKLKIVIDETLTLEGSTLEIPLDETVDLNGKVVNADVTDENGENPVVTGITPSYLLTSNPTNLVEQNATTSSAFKGMRKSASGTDVAALTISASAAGDGNYTDADDLSLSLFVTKPVLKATITFDTENPVFGQEITATITEHEDQSGSLTTDVTYAWGKIVTDEEGKTSFEALSGETSGNLTPNGDGTATVKYTPVAADIGTTLALMVSTPPGETVPTYAWIHSVEGRMANPVAKAAQDQPTGIETTSTKDSITVTKVIMGDGTDFTFSEVETFAAGEKENLLFAKVDKDAAAPGAGDYQASNKFTGLDVNKEYDVYVMFKETDTHSASTVFSKTVSSGKISIDPTDPDESVTITTDPSVKINNDAKYGVEMTTTLTDAEITVDGNPVAGPFYTEYQWYRVTPAVEDDPETEEDETAAEVEEAIADATGAAYTPGADDIGKIIRVKVTPAATSNYSGVVSADTAAVEKADAVFDNTLGIDKASKADATDGAITGLTAGTAYQYAVKPAAPAEPEEGEEPAEPAEPTWIDATADDDGKITGLGVNTYLVRTKENDTHKASEPKEVTVTSLGYNITGLVVSYNAKNAITYKLYVWDAEAGDYSTTETYTGTAVEAEETTTAGLQNQTFLIEGVADGTYKLVLSKDTHLDYTVLRVVVDGQDLDLTTDSRSGAQRMAMGAGDLDGNGRITVTDKNRVTASGTYDETYENAINKNADIDGNGRITVTDKNIVTNSSNYDKSYTDFIVE